MKEFKLDTHPKITPGFIAPDDYFDTLSEKITTQLALNIQEPKVISFYQKHKKTVYAVAAVIALLLSIPFFMETPSKISAVDGAAFEDYISYNTKMTPYELAEYLDVEDIENLKVDFNLSDEVLEESLINNIDVEHFSTY